MKINVNQSIYSISAWERAKFCAARKEGTVFGHFVKQVLGGVINSKDYQKTRKKIEKYAKINGFEKSDGKLKFSKELYQAKHVLMKQNKEFHKKFNEYREEVNSFAREIRDKYRQWNDKLQQYKVTVDKMEDSNKKLELEDLMRTAGQTLEDYLGTLDNLDKLNAGSKPLVLAFKDFDAELGSDIEKSKGGEIAQKIHSLALRFEVDLRDFEAKKNEKMKAIQSFFENFSKTFDVAPALEN